LTENLISDTPTRMGRPPLKKDLVTIPIVVRLSADVMARLNVAADTNRRNVFIREIIERELDRLGITASAEAIEEVTRRHKMGAKQPR
jgi:predicted DNA-binding protein